MNEFYLNIDPTKKNFLVVTKRADGRVHIVHDCKTDEELAEICDYWAYNELSALEVGQSCDCSDIRDCFVLRLA